MGYGNKPVRAKNPIFSNDIDDFLLIIRLPASGMLARRRKKSVNGLGDRRREPIYNNPHDVSHVHFKWQIDGRLSNTDDERTPT